MMLSMLMGSASRPVVSASTSGVSTFRTDATAVAGVRFVNDGTELQSTAAGLYTVSRGNWLDVGRVDQVWMERTLNTGTLTFADEGAGRLPMTATRTYAVHDTTSGNAGVSCTVTFDFYDAEAGGTLLQSVTITLTATNESGL